MWNSGHPIPSSIYVYNGKHKAKGTDTTFVLGSELISLEEAEKLEEFKQTLSNLKKSYKQDNPRDIWTISHILVPCMKR